MSVAAAGPQLKSLLSFHRLLVDAFTELLDVTPMSAQFGDQSRI